MSQKRWAKRVLAAALLLSGCQTVTGDMGEIPVAATREGDTGWVLSYTVAPHDAAATEVRWVLARLESGVAHEQWSAPGVALPAGAPHAISAQLVNRPFSPPVAWVAAAYPGNQYRLHRFAEGKEQSWNLPGEAPPWSARMHVTQHPSGVTWVTFEQPQFESAIEPARELIALDADSARVVQRDVLWADCSAADCRVLRELEDAYVLEEDGAEALRYETGPDIFVPFRAVCRDSGNAPVLITEDSAYPLVAEPAWPVTAMTSKGFVPRDDGSYALPVTMVERFYEFGRLYCDQPSDWLWVSETAGIAYQVEFTAGTVTPLAPELPVLIQYAALRDKQEWTLIYAEEAWLAGKEVSEETLSCDSPREPFLHTCTATYTNFKPALLTLEKAK